MKKDKLIQNCARVLFSAVLILALGACPQPVNDDGGPIAVSGVTIQSDGANVLGYVLWAPADTDPGHPKSVTLDAVISPDNAADTVITWASSRPDIAQVNDGMVTAVSAGDAVITVTTRDGNRTAFCFITVLEAAVPLVPVTGVTVSSSISPNANNRYDVHVNSSLQFEANVTPADASQKGVVWESSDPSVASVGASGFVNALKVGTATITVTTAGNKADGDPATTSFYVYVYAEKTWDPPAGYLNTPLAPHDPVAFYGAYVMYMNEYISLGPKTIYIDGTLSDEIVAQYPYVYNDFMTAVDSGALENGTGEDDRMRVLIAPWVYWCDSLGRDNPAIATDGVGTGLYGMRFSCDWLSLEGLTQDPYNVILCGNRGQQAGSNGNWTVFNINSTGEFYVENLTIANYACFDLEYPLNPSLNVPKRTTAMTQSQLVGTVGSRVFAKNSNFISRLNLMPPSASRTLYVDCHFESTDDSIPGGAGVVYLNCDLDFFSNRPAGGISGVTFLNCTFNSHIGYSDTTGQLISKGDGNGAIIDGRFIHPNPDMKAGWTLLPAATRRNYQYNVTMNGKPILMSADKPGVSVRLEDHPKLLKAYKFTYNGETVYNTYNLLRGTDNWDPMQIKDKVAQASALDPDGLDYGKLPRFMTASASSTSLTYDAGSPPTSRTNFAVSTINTNTDTAVATKFGNIQWSIVSGADGGTIAVDGGDANRAVVTAANLGYTNIPVIVEAVSPYGLHAAVQITSIPAQISAPTFATGPSISYANGKLTLNYTYNVPDPYIVDQSVINWYRAEDDTGTNRVPVMVSRLNEPEPVYTLAPGDVGYYIIAEITPKYQISPAGAMVSIAYSSAIIGTQVTSPKTFNINFQNFPSAYQNVIKAGFWTIDYWRPWRGYQPAEYDRSSNQVTATITAQGTGAPWTYAAGTAGAVGIYGYMNARLSRLMYTPVAGTYKDMSIVLEVATEKNAAQGFGSAACYMDFIIKFDSATNSGYGLRIERIGASGSATVINLVKYDNVEYWGSDSPDWPSEGEPTPTAATPRITYLTTTGNHAMGSASNLVKVFDTFCTIELKVVGSKLSAKVSRDWESRSGQVKDGNDSFVPVELEVTLPEIGASNFGGIMFNNTSTGGQNATCLRYLDIVWQ
jgi:hypothetical protein